MTVGLAMDLSDSAQCALFCPSADLVVTFYPESTGQVALVIYEWGDVPYLGVNTPDNSVGGQERPVRSVPFSSGYRY